MAEETADGRVWDTFDYQIAAYYAPALINGDTSGIEDEADLALFEQIAHNWATRGGWTVGHWSIDDEGEDLGTCEVSGMFAQVVSATLHVYKEAT